MLTITFLAVFVGGLVLIIVGVVIRSLRLSRKKKDAGEHLGHGKNLTAIRQLVEVVQNNPDDLQALFNLASLQLQAELALEAQQNAKKLLERNLSGSGVSHVEAILLLSKAEFSLGNRKEGYRNLMIARGIDSTSPEVNLLLAGYNYDEGNYSDAFGYANRVLKLEPENPDANYYSGMAAYQQGHSETAISYLEKVAQSQPTNFLALYSLGRIYGKLGNITKSSGAFGAALRSAPRDEQRAQVYLQWGGVYSRALNQDKALEAYQQALKLATTSGIKAEALKEMITIYETARRVDKTLEALKKYLALEPLDEIYQAKARYYGELSSNARLKKYEMSSLPDFVSYCSEITKQVVKVDAITSTEINKDGSVDILVNRSTKTQNTNFQFRFVRAKGEIGEMPLRDLYAKMRANSAEKSYLIANTTFNQSAIKFAQTRVVSLINREGLLKLLEKV